MRNLQTKIDIYLNKIFYFIKNVAINLKYDTIIKNKYLKETDQMTSIRHRNILDNFEF